MEKLSPTFSRLTVATVSSFCAVSPALASCAERAMVKQPACAAASSSSGLVPTPFSKRVLKEYWVCLRTPLSVETEPLPLLRSPCQTALALRCIVPSLTSGLSARWSAENSIPGRARRVYWSGWECLGARGNSGWKCDAENTGTDCASSLAAARRAVDHGAILARSAVRALAGGCGSIAAPYSEFFGY